MGSCTRRVTGSGLKRSVVGVCAAWLVVGCGQFDRELLEELFDGDGHGHGGGHHGGGGSGGGGPDVTPCSGFISADDIYRAIAADLASLDADDTSSVRYLSLADQANADGCGAALDGSRAALDKLVNSVSIDPLVTRVEPIDADLTLYRLDLRDYGLDRPIELDGTTHADGWEAIIASSVYAVPFVGDDAEDAVADTGTAVPVLFGDAFVSAVAQAPLYYALLGIPEDIDTFLSDDLGVDVVAARAADDVVRAGGSTTGGRSAEFLAERFDLEVRSGSVWQIFSGDEAAAQALADDPLSTPDSDERELVFTLPNGLFGHALADAEGQRLIDSDLTLDLLQNNFRALVAASYFRLRSQGVTPSDSIRQSTLADPDRFSPEELARILAQYPAAGDLQAIAAGDRDLFATALSRLGIDIDAPEPINQAFVGFDADVDLETAAGALLVTADDLLSNLALLDQRLQVLDGGFMDRGDFNAAYVDSLCILSVVSENAPNPDVCDAAASAP